MTRKCLACYGDMDTDLLDFHQSCLRKLFGRKEEPKVEISLSDIRNLAKESIAKRHALTGVQPKIPVEQQRTARKEKK